MSDSETWREALAIIIDNDALGYWQLSNGSEFWWLLADRSQLSPDRCGGQSFTYSEIVSVSVFEAAELSKQKFECDLAVLKSRLTMISGLQVAERQDMGAPGLTKPSRALQLTVEHRNPKSHSLLLEEV